MARGPRVVVSPPQPRQSLADPAEAPSGMLERITELAQVGTVRMIIWGSVSVCSCAGPRGWHWVAPSARPPSPPPPLPSAPLQNVLRPREARPHAYHYAEDSARAVMAEQLESGRGKPTGADRNSGGSNPQGPHCTREGYQREQGVRLVQSGGGLSLAGSPWVGITEVPNRALGP